MILRREKKVVTKGFMVNVKVQFVFLAMCEHKKCHPLKSDALNWQFFRDLLHLCDITHESRLQNARGHNSLCNRIVKIDNYAVNITCAKHQSAQTNDM